MTAAGCHSQPARTRRRGDKSGVSGVVVRVRGVGPDAKQNSAADGGRGAVACLRRQLLVTVLTEGRHPCGERSSKYGADACYSTGVSPFGSNKKPVGYIAALRSRFLLSLTRGCERARKAARLSTVRLRPAPCSASRLCEWRPRRRRRRSKRERRRSSKLSARGRRRMHS